MELGLQKFPFCNAPTTNDHNTNSTVMWKNFFLTS